MIHQVKVLPKASHNLQQLIELQLSVLELAANRTVVDEVALVQHLQTWYAEQATQVARWIVRKETWLQKLNEFSAHSNQAEKRAVVEKIREDTNLLFKPAAKRLKFSSGKGSPEWQTSAGEFCLYFYELWSNDTKEPGFPAYLFLNGMSGNNSYSRWDFLDEFQHINAGLYLCVICDIAAYRTQVDQRAFASIEHFFPKSIYPHLAIHPYNLVPICPFCNSIAGDKDIMGFCSDEMGITALTLPYSQSQLGFSQNAYVAIQPRLSKVSQNRAEVHPLEIQIRSAVGYSEDSSIHIFNKIYSTEKRWGNELDQIGEHVFRRIQQFLLGDVHMGNDLADWRFVRDRLEMLMALTSQRDLGKDPYAFVALWMLKYFVDTIDQQNANASIYKELKLWAKNQLMQWQELKKHALEIHERVPVTIGHKAEQKTR